MSDAEANAMTDPPAVAVEFRLRPYERVLYTLLFTVRYRALALIGLLLVLVGLGIMLVVDYFFVVGACLAVIGIVDLLGFVWVPFITKRASVLRRFDATSSGLSVAYDAQDFGDLPWAHFYRTRRSAGALILDSWVGESIVIPLRVLDGERRRALEQLARAGRQDRSAIVPADEAGPLITFRSENRFRDALVHNRPAVQMEVWGSAIAVLGLAISATGVTSIHFWASFAGMLMLFGGFLAVAPLTSTLIAILANGPARTLRPIDFSIYRSGYLASGLGADWTGWKTFDIARENANSFVLIRQQPRCVTQIPKRLLSPSDRVGLKAVLEDVGILKGSMTGLQSPTLPSSRHVG